MNQRSTFNKTPLIAAVCAAGSFACGSTEESLLEMTVTPIGTPGGIARSSDGLLALEFSDGALAEATDISVTVYRDHGLSGVLSPVYELGPDGLQFNGPVTLTIAAPGETGLLDIANLDGSVPAVLADSAQTDAAASGTLEHFSSYGLVAGYDPCAGKACADACTLCRPNDSTCVEPAPVAKECNAAGTCLDAAIVQCSGNPAVVAPTRSEVTGGFTNILLDVAALSTQALLDVSGVSDAVTTPGSLGPNSVAFPIFARTGSQPTTFMYESGTFAPVSGTIEHDGLIYFDQQFASGNFSIGFDAARATGGNSGFFVESTTEGFLFIPGIFFDVALPSLVDAQPNSLTIEADLVVAPELAAFRNRPGIVGLDVGDVRISAAANPL